MSNISVAEILKMYGRWIEGKKFAAYVAEKKNVTDRQAYNLIKKAWKNKEILKLPLPNRSVIYGLAEFGAHGNSKLERKRQCGKKPESELDELAQYLSVFQQIPRDPFVCSLVEERLKSKYPRYYRKVEKKFAELKEMNYGYSGFITNPHPQARGIKKRKP